MENKPIKLQHFPSIAAAVSYITAELTASLQVDLARANSSERKSYSNADRKEMRARIADIVAVEPGIHYLSDREHATVLTALRWWQRTKEQAVEEHDIATNGRKALGLTDHEVDQLCERLNCGG